MTFQSKRLSYRNLRIQHIFSICYHPSADLYKHQAVLVWPQRVKFSLIWYKGGANDISLRKKAVFPHSPVSLNYKNVAHLILVAKPPPTCLYPSQAPYLNKSISCLSLCLSLNSSCAETQRTWASVSPDPRWVILMKKPNQTKPNVGSSLNLGFGWVRVECFSVSIAFGGGALGRCLFHKGRALLRRKKFSFALLDRFGWSRN